MNKNGWVTKLEVWIIVIGVLVLLCIHPTPPLPM